ncbi:ParB N-terminal domain-containing protein [Ancylobacter polymorphus]|uniref:ParB-like chromosome segregation protein Spo0J n=1 Tax=Ancylobacter polymorphus TaxID=223390 RepID=A0ABU0BAI5_9HYPH|nr:ParB N-terminal domain-containing protein [Ancylobacter polymorphus]MDQ0302840.1 ParB-like chromosome segregation protein Spo0J [Ancylobacter polymorphus]
MTVTSLEALRKAAVEAKGEATKAFVVKLDDIRRDPAFQVRVDLDTGHVGRLVGAIKAGAELPPITIAFCGDDKEPVVVDGHHRCRAFRQTGATTVNAVAMALPRSQALWRAADANTKHGLPLKPRERREMFRTYVRTRQHVLRAGYGKDGSSLAGQLKSYDDIARDLAIPKPTVWRWMQKDFKKTALKMGGAAEFVGEGGTPPTREDHEKELEAARSALAKLRQAFGDASDYWVRDEILTLARSMLTMIGDQHEVEDELSLHWEDEPLTPQDHGVF